MLRTSQPLWRRISGLWLATCFVFTFASLGPGREGQGISGAVADRLLRGSGGGR